MTGITPYLRTVTLQPDELQDRTLDWPGNARRHADSTLDESIGEHGQYRSVLARELPDGRLQFLGGHGTKAALIRAGLPVDIEVRDVPDDDKARSIVLVDNAANDQASYDERALLALLDDAKNSPGGLVGTGYDEDAYRELLDAAGSENPYDFGGEGGAGEAADETDSEPPEVAITQAGDVWTLGDLGHRVMCGSATSADDLNALTEGRSPGIVYTDPPYGIDIVKGAAVGGGGPYGGSGRNPTGKVIPTTVYKPVIGDDTTDTARDAFALLHGAYPKAVHVWWGANHYAGAAALTDTPCWLVWDKQNDGTNFADAELAWTNHPGAVRMFRHMWNGMIRASERGQRVHPNQKPVALGQWALDLLDKDRKCTDVLDVFGGSGSTLLAAHITGRRGLVMELDPAYVDVICRRWQELTGELPYNERLGGPVDLIAAAHEHTRPEPRP